MVVRPVDHAGDTSYAVTNDLGPTGLAALVRIKQQRHAVEQLFQGGKGEVGLGHYEVRSWTGWHHHVTLSLLALWFLQLERLRLGGKNPGRHGAAGAGDLHGTAARASGQRRAHRGAGERSAAA